MPIIKKNRKGMSIAELIAAIIIIGVASTTITTMVITSYKGQLRAQQYVLANEIAKTYDSMLARDIRLSNIQSMEDSAFTPAEGEKYKEVSDTMLRAMTKIDDATDAPVYKYLYSATLSDHFNLNGKYFDSSNVQIKIRLINKKLCFFKTEVTVTYSNDRQVTYNGTHYKE